MALANWRPRHIMLLWVLALGIEAGLLLLTRNRKNQQLSANETHFLPPTPRLPGWPLDPDSAAVLFYFMWLAPHPPFPDAQDTSRAAWLTALSAETDPRRHDSLWKALGLPGHLSPAQRDSAKAAVAPVTVGLDSALSGMSEAFLAAAILVWAIFALPVVAVTITTLVWWVARRGSQAAA